jgi:hypothetical protein
MTTGIPPSVSARTFVPPFPSGWQKATFAVKARGRSGTAEAVQIETSPGPAVLGGSLVVAPRVVVELSVVPELHPASMRAAIRQAAAVRWQRVTMRPPSSPLTDAPDRGRVNPTPRKAAGMVLGVASGSLCCNLDCNPTARDNEVRESESPTWPRPDRPLSRSHRDDGRHLGTCLLLLQTGVSSGPAQAGSIPVRLRSDLVRCSFGDRSGALPGLATTVWRHAHHQVVEEEVDDALLGDGYAVGAEGGARSGSQGASMRRPGAGPIHGPPASGTTASERDIRPWTAEELDAWMASWDAEFQAHQAERDRQRAARVALYDAGQGARQARAAGTAGDPWSPHRGTPRTAGAPVPRCARAATPRADRRTRTVGWRRRAARSSASRRRSGTSRPWLDERGWLPQERREVALTLFSSRRCTEIRGLRERDREQQARLKASRGGRTERAPIRDALNRDRRRLQFLAEGPPGRPIHRPWRRLRRFVSAACGNQR